MFVKYKNKELSKYQSIFFKCKVRLVYWWFPEILNMLVDREVCLQRNALYNSNGSVDPLSSEYPDMDSVRLNWGLPSIADEFYNTINKLK